MVVMIIEVASVIGCWACMIYASATWGLKAGGIVALALFLGGIVNAALIQEEIDADDAEEEEE